MFHSQSLLPLYFFCFILIGLLLFSCESENEIIYIGEDEYFINPAPQDQSDYIDPIEVKLSWDNGPLLESYSLSKLRIFISDDPDLLGHQWVGQVRIEQGVDHYIFKPEVLEYNKTYYWRIDAVLKSGEGLMGKVWSFTTEYIDIPGVVIDYSPSSSEDYIGSPSIAVLSDGIYIASHDFFGPGPLPSQTAVFESKDKGATWKQIATLPSQFWSGLFYHQNTLYIMGTTTGYGQCIIRKSTDGGYTWTNPEDGQNGLLFSDKSYHTAPVPVLFAKDRIWRAMEDNGDPGDWGYHFRSFMMSAPVDADLLDADSWTTTNRLSHDETNWTGTGWLEGNAVIDPDGEIKNILRVSGAMEVAAIVDISHDGMTASFNPDTGFIDFYGGAVKFTIRYDEISGKYWALVNQQLNPSALRNRLVLVSSLDLLHWNIEQTILEHPDLLFHAFQYVDWLVEEEDIIFVSRTAHNDGQGGIANDYHDANFMTFHRIINFREL